MGSPSRTATSLPSMVLGPASNGELRDFGHSSLTLPFVCSTGVRPCACCSPRLLPVRCCSVRLWVLVFAHLSCLPFPLLRWPVLNTAAPSVTLDASTHRAIRSARRSTAQWSCGTCVHRASRSVLQLQPPLPPPLLRAREGRGSEASKRPFRLRAYVVRTFAPPSSVV